MLLCSFCIYEMTSFGKDRKTVHSSKRPPSLRPTPNRTSNFCHSVPYQLKITLTSSFKAHFITGTNHIYFVKDYIRLCVYSN